MAALFASGFILYNSYKIFRPALGEIMDEHLYDDLVDENKKVSLPAVSFKTTMYMSFQKSRNEKSLFYETWTLTYL